MTHDERISSYIDNELSADQEQEFLISLAASDGLRKSFRSELVLKNVLHRDEASTNPPRKLRAAVFATLGLTATGVAADHAQAAQVAQAGSTAPRVGMQAGSAAPRGIIKALFATKLNILATAGALSITALAGYGVRTVTEPAPQAIEQTSHIALPAPVTSPAQQVQQPVVITQPMAQTSLGSGTSTHITVTHPTKLAKIMQNKIQEAESVKTPVNGTAGSGTINMNPPKLDGH